MEPTLTALWLCPLAATIRLGCPTSAATKITGGYQVRVQVQALAAGTCTTLTTHRTGAPSSRQAGFPFGASRTTAFRSLIHYLTIYPHPWLFSVLFKRLKSANTNLSFFALWLNFLTWIIHKSKKGQISGKCFKKFTHYECFFNQALIFCKIFGWYITRFLI